MDNGVELKCIAHPQHKGLMIKLSSWWRMMRGLSKDSLETMWVDLPDEDNNWGKDWPKLKIRPRERE